MTMRSEEWPEIRIGDLGEVFTGRTPSSDHPAYFGDDFPFITPGDMHQGKYARVTERSLSLEGATLLKRIKIPANSICVSCIGWQMGETIMTAQPSFTNQQINTIVPNGRVEPSFLYYSLRPRKQELLSLGAATGVRTPILNKSVFCDLKVKIPPLSVQQRIAEILSAYDDLIENNTRRIKILEEMAQMIYREWFVKFRFPGHEKVKMVESELGTIPHGWHIERLDKLAQITMGQSPPSEYYNSEGKGLPFHQGVTDFGPLYPENKTYCTLEQRIAKAGDILLSVRAPVGRLNITLNKIVIGRGLCALRSRLNWHSLLFQQLKDHFREEDSMGSGTIFKAVTKDDICGLKFLHPETKVGERFNEMIGPIFRELEVLSAKNTNLRQTRDLLLPRLISGEVSVDHLEADATSQIA
jgi:type I restriction enzyme, S subunit